MDRVNTEEFYNDGIFEHGLTAQGLKWHSRQSQEVRFHQLLSLLPLNTASIVDAGCGFGDLYLYLSSHSKKCIDYIGLDSLDIMVKEARQRTGQPIYQCDILYDPLVQGEFYLCSGALNILTKNGGYRFIQRCYEASSRGMVFNFLEGEKESKTYNYLQADKLKKLGQEMGAQVVFRRGYYEKDCTVAFYKASSLTL
jgi:SAM-dependent methyltransferase